MGKRSIFLFVLLFSSFLLVAQNYVTLHDQCNYAGRQFTLEAGSFRLYQMKIDNDKLSSIQIPNGWKVTIYENDKFEGRSNTYTSNITCLDASWRNTASSIIVEAPYNTQPGYSQNDYITFYNDCYSKGYSQSLRPGTYTGSQLGALKYNISSFIIYGNLRVRAYLNNENPSGASALFDASQTCLSSSHSDKIGALVIEYKPNQPTNPTTSYPPGGGSAGNGSYATLYTDCNYNGNALRLMPGTYQGDKLGLLKYNAASIQLSSNLRARVYLDNEYLSGTSYLIDNDNNCMNTNLRNRIGSLVIEEKYGSGGNQTPPPTNESVIIYVDGNYKGQAATLLPGTYSTMAQAGFPDDAISSIIVPAGYRVVLYEYANFKGKSYTITESKTGFTFSGWNDRASSIAVYRN
jgi:hypothetical protein